MDGRGKEMTMVCRYSRHSLLTILAVVLALTEPVFSQDAAKKIPQADYSLDLPSPERLFHIRSEEGARQEIREAAMKRGVKKVEFPLDAKPLPVIFDVTQTTPPHVLTVPLAQVCYGTLYYQDIRTERYGQSWGVVEPLRSAFLFYGKTLILPGMLVAVPPCRIHCWNYPFVPIGD
jgi:hypothetical protein